MKLEMWSATSLLFLQSLHLFIGTSSSTLLTTTSCICPGRQLVYECTVAGSAIQSTVWRGSALDCSRGISLLHGQFMDIGFANGTCNGGDIFALILSHDGDRFTSRLTVNTSLDMNGKEIQCASDDGRDRIPIYMNTITIKTAPFPPPTDVQLIDVQVNHITFNWTSVDAQCDSVSYNIFSFNCGRCPITTSNTTVTCADAVFSGQVCIFHVQAIVCGNIVGNLSDPLSVIMKVPRVSTVHSVPRYDHVTGSLQTITSSFDALDLAMTSNGYQIQVSSYSISYKDSSTGNICSQGATIPIASCADTGVCKHIFEVSSSFCHPSTTNITVTVVTTNMFGSTQESDPLMIVSRNIFTDVNFTILYKGDTLQIMCTFLNTTRINGERSCTVMFGNGLSSCRNLSQSLRSEQSTASASKISVELPLVLVKQNILCLIVRASDDLHTVESERKITVISGCDKDHLGDGTTPSDGVACGLPLLSAGIKNGVVCYTGTSIGATATHHCFNCGSITSSSIPTVRTCLPNGTWNGTVPRCQCSIDNINTTQYTAISMGIVIIITVSALVVMTTLFIRLKIKVQRILQQIKPKEIIPIYDDINLAEIIDPKKNVAYETASQLQRQHTVSY